MKKSRALRSVAMCVWVFLGFLYISLVSQWCTLNSRDKLLTEYINRVIQIAASEQRPAKDVRAQLLIKAEDLSLPVRGEGIHVSGKGQTLRATVQYKSALSMPIVNQPVYAMRFDHDLSFH